MRFQLMYMRMESVNADDMSIRAVLHKSRGCFRVKALSCFHTFIYTELENERYA